MTAHLDTLRLLRHALLFALALCTVVALPASAQTAAAEKPRFDVLEYVVEGNTVLGTELIERAVYPFLGEGRTIDDVESARAALELVYRNAGYGTVSVDIPEQRVAAGTVTLRVVQGAVARLRVTGAKYYAQQRILDQVPALAEGQVPNLPQVQEQLAAVNRSADRRVLPLLRPGKQPGTTEVDLQVEDRLPLHGSLELNNRASASTSQTRLVGGLRYDNLFQREHSIALQLQTSPEATREVKVLALSYTVPLGNDSWSYSVIRSDSEVAAGVGDTTVFGKGTIWGARRSFVTELREGTYAAFNAGVEYKDFQETVDAGTGAGFATPVRYLPLSAGWLRIVEDDAGRWQFGATATLAIGGLVGDDAQFADKRFRARSSFGHLKFDIARDWKLPRTLTLGAKLEGQVAGAPLISNEQFVAGGADSVRGYYESAAVGDQGLRGSVELRSGNLAAESWPLLRTLNANAFVDAAWTRILEPLPAQTDRFRLAGAGFGLQLGFKPAGTLTLSAGWPLKTLGTNERGSPRLHASGVIEF